MRLPDLAFGDFTGDGKTDVFRADGTHWYISEGGTGSWRQLNTSAVRLPDLAFGDFTGDGKTDVFRADGTHWYISEGGTGSWRQLNTSAVRLPDLAFGDFTGDGKTDVFRADGTHWYISEGGTGSWRQLNTSAVRLPDLAFGDFTGDGKTDVFRADGTHWYISEGGTGSWRQLNTSAVRLPDLAFGDFTGDGKTDVLSTDKLPWLLRTTAMSRITGPEDWLSTAASEGSDVKVFRQGPALPTIEISVVQPSGGHDRPTYYASDQAEGFGQRIWKWRDGMNSWQQIVPGRGPGDPVVARRFFVDPYRPAIIYVLGDQHVHRSTDGGASWVVDTVLEASLTQNGAFPVDLTWEAGSGQALLRDMLFDSKNAGWRVATGPAGIFQTRNGRTWDHLVVSAAAAMRPNNAVVDRVTDPRRAALYVATSNRGVLKVEAKPPYETFSVRQLARDCLGLKLPISLRGGIFPAGESPPLSLLQQLRTIRDNCS